MYARHPPPRSWPEERPAHARPHRQAAKQGASDELDVAVVLDALHVDVRDRRVGVGSTPRSPYFCAGHMTYGTLTNRYEHDHDGLAAWGAGFESSQLHPDE